MDLPPQSSDLSHQSGRLTPSEADRPFIRRLALVVLALAIVIFLYQTKDLLLLAFGAVLGAVLLSAMSDWLTAKTGMSRSVGLILAVATVLAAIALMAWLFGAETASQAQQLRSTLPEDWNRIKTSLDADPVGKLLLGSVERGANGSGMAARLLTYGGGAIEVAVNFIIILVGAVFFASEPKLYRRGLVLTLPPQYRAVAQLAVDDVGQALKRWLLTQLVSMALMGTMIGIGLWLSGVRAPVALGVLGGLSEFVPYVGPTLAMIPAIIVALAGKGSLWGTLLTFLIVRIVQANIITPLLTRRLVSVPPGLYLFMILAAGFAFGTFGLFFSGALAVAAYTLAVRLYSRETLADPVEVPGRAE